MNDMVDPIQPAAIPILPEGDEAAALAATRPYLDAMLGPEVDVRRRVRAAFGADVDFAGKRVALAAMWDPDGIIDPYVQHYFRHLNNLGYLVVGATDRDTELPSDAGWLSALAIRDCPGYDFTSWKAAFALFPSLCRAEEVILLNDSVFAPFGSFEPVFAAMRNIACDFWGLCESWQRLPHLQSYFISLGKKALQSEALGFFFSRVQARANRDYAVDLEVALTAWLVLHGLRAGAFIPARALPMQAVSPIHLFWRQLIERHGVPVLKRNIMTGQNDGVHRDGWEKLAETKGYPPELIRNYLARGIFKEKRPRT